MAINYDVIDVNGRLTAEQHILLFTFKVMYLKQQVEYNAFIVYEELIQQYNRCIQSNDLNEFKELVESYDSDVIKNFIVNFNNQPWQYEKPIIWKDRNKSRYFIENLTLSHQFEVYIESMFRQYGVEIGLYYGKNEQYNQGETRVGIEIKRDIKAKETGNLYIEFAERLNNYGNWVNSGILKDDNTRFFLIGDTDGYWILAKNTLLAIYEELTKENGAQYMGCSFRNAKRGTSRGFIIPQTVANRIRLSVEDVARVIA